MFYPSVEYQRAQKQDQASSYPLLRQSIQYSVFFLDISYQHQTTLRRGRMLLRHRLQNVFLLLPVQSVNFALIWLPSVTKTAKTASLRAMNPKLIDDCDLVNDKLLLSFPKMTTKPHFSNYMK